MSRRALRAVGPEERDLVARELRVALLHERQRVVVEAEPDVQPVLLDALVTIAVAPARPLPTEPPAVLDNGDVEGRPQRRGAREGMGGGQTSRIGALEHALHIACDEAKDAVMASDGFLPHTDNIHAAAQNRIGAIIQPGGSIKDKDVIDLANRNGMTMVLTGVREFRH